jgi:HEPN domain-containing protein
LNSVDMARSYLRQAEERVSHASEALSNGNYAFVVRQSQEAVELSLKAALRLVGIEPPKWNDVGPVLKDERKRFPAWFEQVIDQLASISRSLRKERELAMYGDEESGASPDKLYSRMDAETSLKWASLVLSNVKRLLGEQVNNKP